MFTLVRLQCVCALIAKLSDRPCSASLLSRVVDCTRTALRVESPRGAAQYALVLCFNTLAARCFFFRLVFFLFLLLLNFRPFAVGIVVRAANVAVVVSQLLARQRRAPRVLPRAVQTELLYATRAHSPGGGERGAVARDGDTVGPVFERARFCQHFDSVLFEVAIASLLLVRSRVSSGSSIKCKH